MSGQHRIGILPEFQEMPSRSDRLTVAVGFNPRKQPTINVASRSDA